MRSQPMRLNHEFLPAKFRPSLTMEWARNQARNTPHKSLDYPVAANQFVTHHCHCSLHRSIHRAHTETESCQQLICTTVSIWFKSKTLSNYHRLLYHHLTGCSLYTFRPALSIKIVAINVAIKLTTPTIITQILPSIVLPA